ncbi:hypothetical protein BB559_005186, partial [Furculomyces boomerangus]
GCRCDFSLQLSTQIRNLNQEKIQKQQDLEILTDSITSNVNPSNLQSAQVAESGLVIQKNLHSFELITRIYEYCPKAHELDPETCGVRLLKNSFSYEDLQWIESNSPNTADWAKIIALLKSLFIDQTKLGKALNELWSINLRKNEFISDFLKRLQRIMFTAGFSSTDQGTSKNFLICLPETIKWNIESQIMKDKINNSFIDISQQAIKFSKNTDNRVKT